MTAVRHLCVDVGNGRCAPPKVDGVTFPSERNQSGDVVWFNSFVVSSGELEGGAAAGTSERRVEILPEVVDVDVRVIAGERITGTSTSRPKLRQSLSRARMLVSGTSPDGACEATFPSDMHFLDYLGSA